MSNQEARRLVAEGLQRRKEQRQEAEREAKLEHYEQEQMLHIHKNCADARKEREAKRADRDTARLMAQTEQYNKAQLVASRKAQREQMLRDWERDYTASNSVRGYILACMSVMLVAAWTPLPWWAAAALIAGTAVCEAAYIFRLYFPFERMVENA